MLDKQTLDKQTKKEVEAYTQAQDASGLKVGDKVKILRKANTHECGWYNSWLFDMDKLVGETEVIDSISTYGIRFKSKPYEYPFFVLEKVK